jgi:hypothetical protein
VSAHRSARLHHRRSRPAVALAPFPPSTVQRYIHVEAIDENHAPAADVWNQLTPEPAAAVVIAVSGPPLPPVSELPAPHAGVV